MTPLPIHKDVLTSAAPMWFHPSTGTPLQKHYSRVEIPLVFAGFTGNVCICAALVFNDSILHLDSGMFSEYSDYVTLGIRVFSDLGYDGASGYAVYRNPVVGDLGSVLGDLLVSSRPSVLCTQKHGTRGKGNVYVPDYVRLLRSLHVATGS